METIPKDITEIIGQIFCILIYILVYCMYLIIYCIYLNNNNLKKKNISKALGINSNIINIINQRSEAVMH